MSQGFRPGQTLVTSWKAIIPWAVSPPTARFKFTYVADNFNTNTHYFSAIRFKQIAFTGVLDYCFILERR